MPIQPLPEETRSALLTFARATITQAILGGPEPKIIIEPLSPRVQSPGASFVTLRMRKGSLRGCIGTLEPHRPLVEDIQANALNAAFHDPRFSPLSATELAQVVIEISVLTPSEPLAFDGPEDLIEKLRPGVDGVLIEHGWHRATFLPQVWDQLPVPQEFLSHLCYKAGLPNNAWQWPDLKVYTYQVEKFEEEIGETPKP